MRYDALYFPRNMMRFYSLIGCGRDENVIVERNPELWQDYRKLENLLFPAFEAKGIRPVPVRVLSDFNGEIKTVLQLVFCCAEPALEVPRDLYELVGSHGKPGFKAPETPPVIRLGYTGRCYDYVSGTKLITDGIQIGALGKIVLDMFSLQHMPKDGVTCRLTHELLHVFGVSEAEMDSYKPAAYLALRPGLNDFSTLLLNQLTATVPRFQNACSQIAAEHPDWVTEMEGLGNRLYREGFPYPPSKVLSAGIRLPQGVNGTTVRWCSKNVLFM